MVLLFAILLPFIQDVFSLTDIYELYKEEQNLVKMIKNLQVP
jgi:hypothetical protein